MNDNYLDASPGPATDWRERWRRRIGRALMLVLALLFVVAVLLAGRFVDREPTGAEIARRAGLCEGAPAEVRTIAPGVVWVVCEEVGHE